MTEFSAFLACEKFIGSEFATLLLDEYNVAIENSATQLSILETTGDSWESHINRYYKPTVLLNTLRQKYGEEKMTELTNEEKQAIWGELYNEAISVFEDSLLYLEAKTPLSIALLTNAAVSLFIGALAPYLVMPLILGNGQTIGKYMLGLALVNDKGFKIKRWQVVVRYLILGGFEVGASVPLYAIPLFLTSASLTITYGARTFHDFLAKTYVVDAYESQIFDSASEEDTYFNPTKNPKDKAKIYFYKMERRKSNPSKKA